MEEKKTIHGEGKKRRKDIAKEKKNAEMMKESR